MKMVICFDTEDEKGMQNSIKMMDHLAKEYMGRRVMTTSTVNFGKIEFIKVLRVFAANIAAEGGLTNEEVENNPNNIRQKEDWEGLRFSKLFADKVFSAKSGGLRIGDSNAPISLLKD